MYFLLQNFFVKFDYIIYIFMKKIFSILFLFIFLISPSAALAQSDEGASSYYYLEWIMDKVAFFGVIFIILVILMFVSIKNGLRIVDIFIPSEDPSVKNVVKDEVSQSVLNSGNDGLL